MEGNYWKRWSVEDDQYLFSVFKECPLTEKGYLSTKNGVGILVSNMAFRFRRTEGAIKRRVIHLRTPQHPAYKRLFYSSSHRYLRLLDEETIDRIEELISELQNIVKSLN